MTMPQFTGRHGRDEIIESNVTFAGGLSVGGDFTVDDLTASGTVGAIAANLGAGGTTCVIANGGNITSAGTAKAIAAGLGAGGTSFVVANTGNITSVGTAQAIAGAFGAGGTSVKLTNAGGVTAVGALSGASGTVSGLLTVGTLTLGAANLGAAATAATYVAGTAPVIVANQAYAAMTIGGTAYKILLFK
jgi:hypothetical protein